MATLPYPFLRRSRCGVPLIEEGDLHSLEEWTDVTLQPLDSALLGTVGDSAASLREGVGRQCTTSACEAQMGRTINRMFDETIHLLLFGVAVQATCSEPALKRNSY